MTEPHYWLMIQDAPDHVRVAASVTVMQPGHGRVSLYYGPDRTLYALLISGDAGSQPDRWVRLPDFPSLDL